MKAFLIVAAVLILPQVSLGRTWVIENDGSGDIPTIQAGIDSAAVGDTVLVGPGTYLEHPNFLGKDIVLRSGMGPEATILDGSLGQELWVVGIRNGESGKAILEGFTITNGSGGVSIRNSEPTIMSNIVEGNAGPGIACTASSSPITFRPIICGNIVRGNVSEIFAGGIGATVGVAPKIVDNIIKDNEATAGGTRWSDR
jgi:hypothetical protein